MSTSGRKRKIHLDAKKARQHRAFVPTTAFAKSVSFGNDMMHVTFMDGRILAVPLVWFPVLGKAPLKELAKCEIAGGGISLHWPDLDEDLSIAGLMAGVDQRSA